MVAVGQVMKSTSLSEPYYNKCYDMLVVGREVTSCPVSEPYYSGCIIYYISKMMMFQGHTINNNCIIY